MTPETFIKAQLAMAAHEEAGHLGGVDGMKAVAFVLRNRVRAGWHGGDWMQNIENLHQYSGHAGTVADRERLPVPIREITFRLFLQAIDDIFQGIAPDPYTEGALFYAELHRINRAWFRENVLNDLERHRRVATVAGLDLFS